MANRRVIAAVGALVAVLTAAPVTAAMAEFALERSQPDGASWVWPLQPPPMIVRLFSPPDEAWHPGHRGIDLLGSPSEPVRAIGDGLVTFAGPLAGRGVVVIDHGELRSTYEPVLAHVVVGDRVRAGDPVGVLQAVGSHCSPQICLHLGVKRGETYLDPLDLLTRQEVRLKPPGGDLSTRPQADASSATHATSPRSSQAGQSKAEKVELSTRSLLGGAAAATAVWLAAERKRRPQARG